MAQQDINNIKLEESRMDLIYDIENYIRSLSTRELVAIRELTKALLK